jgi:hypothetical protein
MLAVGGTADADSVWGTALANEHSAAPRKAEEYLAGAGHFVFTGGCDAARTALALVSTTFCGDSARGVLSWSADVPCPGWATERRGTEVHLQAVHDRHRCACRPLFEEAAASVTC